MPNVRVGAGAALLSVRGVDCDVEEDELRRGLALRAVGRAALDAHRPAVVGRRPRELGAQRDAVAGVGDLLRRVRPAVVRRVRVVAELALLARVAQPAAAVDFVDLLHVGEGGGADQEDGEAEEQRRLQREVVRS